MATNTNDRLMAFSDGILAVVITLLVLSIDIPDTEKIKTIGDFKNSLINLGPKFEIYFLSFAIIGFFWHRHHLSFTLISGHDTLLTVLNLTFLLFISILPFATELIGDFSSMKIAVDFYSLSMLMACLSLTALWKYALKNNFVSSKHDSKVYSTLNRTNLFLTAVFFLSLLLSFVNLRLAKYSWLLIFVGQFFIHKRTSNSDLDP